VSRAELGQNRNNWNPNHPRAVVTLKVWKAYKIIAIVENTKCIYIIALSSEISYGAIKCEWKPWFI
jgi:hypothetical protein